MWIDSTLVDETVQLENLVQDEKATSPAGQLTIMYLLALSMVALLSIAGQVLIQSTLRVQSRDSALINMAGRQRMLSQRISKAALELGQSVTADKQRELISELDHSLSQWMVSHKKLKASELGAEAAGIMATLEPHLMGMYTAGQELTKNLKSGYPPNQKISQTDYIMSHEAIVLQGLEKLVGRLELDARRRVDRLEVLEFLLLAITLLVLTAEALLIFRPAARRIQRDFVRLGQVRSELQRLSLSDGLTGIANRRFFDMVLERELRRSARTGESLAALMIDIDHFKKYNDTHGHLAGDEALKKVASVLAERVRRPADIVARYGGEEFVALLSGSDLSGARGVAESIRRRVQNLNLPNQAARPNGILTISLGLALCHPGPDQRPKELLAEADRALYQAKETGRNRVVVAPCNPPSEESKRFK